MRVGTMGGGVQRLWKMLFPVVAMAWVCCFAASDAQVAHTIEPEGFQVGSPLTVGLTNASRPDNTVVLYTPDFGPNTRTNPYGVEVVAILANRAQNRYKVQRVTSVWACEKTNLSACGNAAIPQNGIVLSASGDRRKDLLEALPVGEVFRLSPVWFQQRSTSVTVINPGMENNAGACGFPGCRGGNQMVVYDAGYGKQKTGTNEFGFEVTVIDGMVVANEGADSTIPAGGFVVSGHGRARDWLIANAPLGARISVDVANKTLTSAVDLWTYRYQLARRMEDARCMVPLKICQGVTEAERKIDQLQAVGKNEQAAALAVETLETLNKGLWSEYPKYPSGSIQAAWHRPTETDRASIGQTLDFLKASGLNTVFLEAFFHGYTIYPSAVMAQYGLPRVNPKYQVAGDLLKLWLEESRKRGIKLHIWFQDFYAGNKVAPPETDGESGPILAKYPQWANVQFSAKDRSVPTASTLESGGFFLDPANPEVQTFLLALAEEMVTQYDVDGFQLDYIRYPASFPPDRFSFLPTTWGYTPVARSAFMQTTGFDPVNFTKENLKAERAAEWKAWNDYKVGLINGYVARMASMIRAKAPRVLISADIFSNLEESRIRKHQDWVTWANNGWVDFLAPLTLTSAVKVVEEDTWRVRKMTNDRVPVVAGVFGPFNGNTAEDMLDQIEMARVAGAKGFAIFDTAHMTGRMGHALHAAHGLTASPPKSYAGRGIIPVPAAFNGVGQRGR